MKKFFFLFFTIILTLLSCENKKIYKYIESVEDNFGGRIKIEKFEEEIKAINDTAAYLEAFAKYSISEKIKKEFDKEGLSVSKQKVLGFELYDNKGKDISNINFSNKEIRKKEILEQVYESKNYAKRIKSQLNEDILQNVDSNKIKELIKYFDVKKDEFSNDNVIWYKPKSAPKYVNQNGIYCYFQTQNDIPNNFRFRVQYMAEDWLFFESVQFSIDGNAYKYIPLNTKTDHGNGLIWEWFDEQISSSSDRGLIEALAYSKNVKVKFNGRQYQKIKKLTKNQIIDIKNTLELYRAMGGKF